MHRTPFARGVTRLRFLAVSLLAAFLTTPVSAFASCSKDPECDDVAAWVVFTRVALKQSVAGSGQAVEWVGLFDHKALDVSIDGISFGTKEPVAGTVGLVGGQVMLTKGLKLEPGYEIDTLDVPVLSMKLVMILLKRVFPTGPDQIVGPSSVDYTGQVGIKYATPSASGYIPAPWRVKGTVNKLAHGALAYQLALSFPSQQHGKKGSVTIQMQGDLAVLGRPVFNDSDSLAGWTTYGIGPQQIKQGSSTILDYGATPQGATRYRTIGDIRAFIAAENHPGERDATKDFTGFWKNKCDQPFGLQIKHHGNAGEYSVVFCGPGGCDEPSQGRSTFITGDKRYEVVSEGELIRITRSGERHTYYRCTKEANPVLGYRK